MFSHLQKTKISLTLSLACPFPPPLPHGSKFFSLCPPQSLAHCLSPKIACTALLPVRVYGLLYALIFILILLLTSCFPSSPTRLPSCVILVLRPPPALPLSPLPLTHHPPSPHSSCFPPSFLAVNSPYVSHLYLLGLLSHPPRAHPSHFPHVRHPPCLDHLSPPRPALPCPLGPPSSRLVHPCDLTLSDLTLSAWVLGSRVRLTSLPLPSLLTLLSPNSLPPHALHTCIAHSPSCLCRHQDMNGT